MRRFLGIILILIGVGLWFLPPTLESLPAQYTQLGTILHWGGPALALAGSLLLLPSKKTVSPEESRQASR